MERFSARENLLGHNSGRRSFGGSPNLTPTTTTTTTRNSDLDFKDVFGGPPRRSSLHEWRNSLATNSNSSGGGGGDEEETISSRNPWSGLSEKPVFGEETNFNRRSNPSDEFFDDIFRGDDYSTSTPTRDPFFSTTPSSRVLSPARPLPPQSEPSFVGSSLPIPLSLPTKLAKGIDQAFASPSHSPFNRKQTASGGLGFPASPIASKVSSTQLVQGRDDLRNDTRPFLGISASSRGFHLNNEESSRAIKKTYYKDAEEDYLEKNSTSSEANNSTKVQFHFSIYKWVSKGVPSTMTPLRRRNSFTSKTRVNTETIESELSGPVSQVVQHHSVSDDDKSAEEKSWEYENQDKSSGLKPTKKDTIGSSTFIVEVASAKPESEEPVASFISHKAGKGLKPDSVASGAPRATAKEVPVLMEQSCTLELKPLYSAFKDESDIQGNDKMVQQPGVKEGTVERIDALVGNVDNVKKVKKPTGKRNLLNLSEETSSSLLDSSTSLENKPIRNKVKGKVKDFVMIFNQDSPSKPTNVKNSQSTGVKGASACQVEDEVMNVLPTKGDVKEKVSNMKNKGTLTETLVMDGEISEKLEKTVKPGIGINKSTPRKIYTVNETIDASTSFSESIPNIPEGEAGKVEESLYEDLQGNCLVEELSLEQNKLSQTGQNSEEIQACDAKVRKWSNGKQGNIRSLLSTLQYVLWPESGWKPVPLVDIIEGNSVKRTYQKALLCLHPDKLQQKGAAPHQKYIAEKVFDILQAPPSQMALEDYNTLFEYKPRTYNFFNVHTRQNPINTDHRNEFNYQSRSRSSSSSSSSSRNNKGK